jgi:transposase
VQGAQAAGARAQKKTLRAAEQDREEVARERASYRDEAVKLDPAGLIFLDESGVTTKMTRTHARAPRGERARGSVPCGGWPRVTLLGALGPEGVVAMMSIEAATSTAVFLAFLDHVLLPELARRRPGATLVMDNLAPHKAEAVRERIEGAGLRLRFLPRYSPDLNPIEPCWSKIKTLLRAKEARSVDALDRELPGILDAVTAQDARGWFRHCGYPAPD